MGAVWGAISGKFVITAVGLLVASRIDQARLGAVIDPHVARSAISSGFAERHHLGGVGDLSQTANRHPLSIGIGAEEFDQHFLAIAPEPVSPDADLVLGRDVLDEHIFAFDMRRQEVALVEQGELGHLVRHFNAVPASWTQDGRLGIAIAIDGRPTDANLDLGQADAVRIGLAMRPSSVPPHADQLRVQVAGTALDAMTISPHPSGDGAVSLGLAAFAGRTIVLDLPHGRLWISDPALSSR